MNNEKYSERRKAFVRMIAAYDREIAHPEIYEDLEDE